MESTQIQCPKCQRGLKLRDRSKLGKPGKCPSCGHRFLLQAPDESEVDLELADDEIPAGTSAQWVPDAASPAPAAVPTAAAPVQPVVTDGPIVAVAEKPTERLARVRQSGAKRRNIAIAMGALTALAAFVVYRVTRPADGAAVTTDAQDPGPADTTSDDVPAIPVNADVWRLTSTQQSWNQQLVDSVANTDAEPIQLYMMPSGVNLVIHLRPARLWGNEAAFQELRATLTQNLTDWIAEKLRTVCRREPEQIEEALIGIMLGARGTEPEIAAVVRLVEDARLSDLIEEFRGEPLREEGGLRLYRAETHAYLIRDTKTIAIAPAALGDELADWISTPNYQVPDGVLQLLRYTDRDRLFTTVFQVDDIRLHEEWLFSEDVRPVIARVLDAFSDDAEAVCWSLDLDENLSSELHFRTRVAGAREVITPVGLAGSMESRLDEMPHDVMDLILRMQPETRGGAAVIGRYPAMLEAYRRASVPTIGPRYVKLTTVLPAKAAPNLALATMLTWDLGRRTDFSSAAPPPVVAQTKPELPETVVERLKLPVDIEFGRTPLHEAMTYICDSIEVELDVDGDALMLAGYTQNMPQTMNLGKVPASEGIHAIISQYDGGGKAENLLVIALDEQAKKIILITNAGAEKRGLTPHDVAPAE